jgi:YfiH family protein
MTRVGGVSRGPFSSMNLAEWVGDEESAVAANWLRWQRAHPGMRAARLSQVHGNTVIEIAADYDGSRAPADGMVTSVAGLALGVFSADCVPILMIDHERHVACALHAGWRGTLADIARAGVDAMKRLGARPSEIQALLGPAIGRCCFEVDSGLADTFAGKIEGVAHHRYRGNTNKAYLDLPGIIRNQLERAGVSPAAIISTDICTRCCSDRFFSRRAAAGAITGLQMSFVGFEA